MISTLHAFRPLLALLALSACGPSAESVAPTQSHVAEQGEIPGSVDDVQVVDPSARQAPRAQTFRLAVVDDHPAEAMRKNGGLAATLATWSGLTAGEVYARPDRVDVVQALCAGEVDALLESADAIRHASARCGGKAVLVAAKGGDLRYRSLFVTRSDASFASLSDLRGHDVLFEAANSTSAYVVPRGMLQDAGLTVVADTMLSPDDVRYRFVGDELNVIGGVVHGRAAAGAVSSSDLKVLQGAEVKVIAESKPIPRQILLVSSSFPEDRIKSLVGRAVDLAECAQHEKALSPSTITHFDRFGPDDEAAVTYVATVSDSFRGGAR